MATFELICTNLQSRYTDCSNMIIMSVQELYLWEGKIIAFSIVISLKYPIKF